MVAAEGRLRRLKTRKQFLRAARGRRAGRSAFSLQAVDSPIQASGVGFTVTKKVGNAPQRNRIRRRLREAVNAEALALKPFHDYVLVGRREALSVPFAVLGADLRALLARVHDRPRSHPGDRGQRDPTQ